MLPCGLFLPLTLTESRLVSRPRMFPSTHQMSLHLRYGEPDWNEPPRQDPDGRQDIQQRPLSNKNYEELRYEATQKQWTTKFVDMNTMALSSLNPNATFVNLQNLTDTVEVVVGEGDDQAQWVIHSSLLTNDSELASMALSRDFKEKNGRIIRFPEEDPGVFGQYVTFLYAKMVFVFALETLVQMYTLGDRLQSVKFANACYETIAKTTDPYSAHQIKYIFDNTYTDDRLRKLCILQVGKGILDGRYAFAIPHEQELLRDFMPELMLGVTNEVQKRRESGEKWYPKPGDRGSESGFSWNRPSTSPQNSPPTSAPPPLFRVAPARPATGGLFTTRAGFGSGAGGLFSDWGTQPSSTTTSGSSFGAQDANAASAGGGLFSNQTTRPSGGSLFVNQTTAASASGGNWFGGATVPNPHGGLFRTGTVNASRGGLFSIPASSHSTQHANNIGPSSGSLFVNARPLGGSPDGPTTKPAAAKPGLFSMFGQPSQPQHGFGSRSGLSGNSQGEVQITQAQQPVYGSGNTSEISAAAASTTSGIAQTPAQISSTAQKSSVAPSLFKHTSTTSPFAASPAPTGPPVFSFPNVTSTPREQEQQASTSSFTLSPSAIPSAIPSAPAAPQSAPQMWTVRGDNPWPQGVNNTSSQQNGTVNNTSANNGESDEDGLDAWSLAALEKASAINNPTVGFAASTASNFIPTNSPKFGSSPFHQIMSGKRPAEETNPFGQRMNGWRPAENGKQSRFVGPQGTTDGHENNNEEGKGKQPALDDAELSRDLMNLAFPGNRSIAVGDDEYLKNSQGGKITKDDKLSPGFEEYLRSASQEKRKEK